MELLGRLYLNHLLILECRADLMGRTTLSKTKKGGFVFSIFVARAKGSYLFYPEYAFLNRTILIQKLSVSQ